MLFSARGAESPALTRPFFQAPHVGHRILAGFSYLQRINKGACTRLWMPHELNGKRVEWAAVRQFELLQESGNLSIEDLELTEIKRSFQSLMKMRAGGYRVTVLTLGDYVDRPEADDLCLLDQKLQEEITRLIHFLYLDEISQTASHAENERQRTKGWTLATALPHVAMAVGEKRLFKPQRETLAERTFFEILARLPARQIAHDIAIGLALPDASKEKNWVYLAKGEHKPAAFFAAIGQAVGETIHHQMRAHGDRLKPHHTAWQSGMALAA